VTTTTNAAAATSSSGPRRARPPIPMRSRRARSAAAPSCAGANPEPSPFVAAMRRIASETSLQREAPPVADPTPSTPVQLRSAEPPPPPAADAPKAAESESLVPSDGDAMPPLEKLAPHGVPALATGAASDDHVHEAAQRGVAGAGSALPHGDAIQRAFGRHDISGVQAHVGGEAATASRAIGAEAYATGDHVAFAAAPSLHTAAHEAGHVVQQRGGVQLKGGVGEAGDAYEQHANAVADAVVQGKSSATKPANTRRPATPRTSSRRPTRRSSTRSQRPTPWRASPTSSR